MLDQDLCKYPGLMRFCITKESPLSLRGWILKLPGSLTLAVRSVNISKCVSPSLKKEIMHLNCGIAHATLAPALGMRCLPALTSMPWLVTQAKELLIRTFRCLLPQFPSWAPKPCYSLPASHFLRHDSSSNERTLKKQN